MEDFLKLPPVNIPALLRRYQIHPHKGLGQNFLVDDDALRRIVGIAGIKRTDEVLEIGAGIGNLTRYLTAYAHKVIAVEIDSQLIPVLKEMLKYSTNVEIIQGDILSIELADLPLHSGFKVVANIPYYLTSALIRKLLESPLHPNRLVLTLQREVAERICAQPGDMSLLALSVQVYGLPSIVEHLPAEAFYPSPKVDSCVVLIDRYKEPVIPQENLNTYFRLAKAGFSNKRKTMRNSLSAGLSMPANQIELMLTVNGIDPKRRAETLSLEEWATLTAYVTTLSPTV